MSLVALGLVLLQAAAATPTPTPRPVPAGPRTLQDVARERRLGGAKGKGSIGTISVGPSSSSTPAKPTAEAETPGEPAPTPEPAAASVRVSTVSNDGVVDATGGVRVNGTVRNGGFKPACNVVISVKILDSRGVYLSSGEATPDVATIAPGEVVSFHTMVQAPPKVRGARTTSERKDLVDGSTTMGGDWKLLGGTEASIASASEECGK